jgi:hypothetical protein
MRSTWLFCGCWIGQRGLEVDVAAERVAADLGAVARGTFHVDAAAHRQLTQRGERQALLHDVEVGRVVLPQPRHGQAHTVHRHAGADGQARLQNPGANCSVKLRKPGWSATALDGGDALNDACKHGASLAAPGRA